MIPINDLLLFGLAALIMVLSPGPNMIYLISRSLSQGKKAGIISLFGVMCGFLFHILMVSFGLTAIFFAVPYAFVVVKFLGVGYLLYLAYNTVKSKNKIFNADQNLKSDKPFKLFNIGLFSDCNICRENGVLVLEKTNLVKNTKMVYGFSINWTCCENGTSKSKINRCTKRYKKT